MGPHSQRCRLYERHNKAPILYSVSTPLCSANSSHMAPNDGQGFFLASYLQAKTRSRTVSSLKGLTTLITSREVWKCVDLWVCGGMEVWGWCGGMGVGGVAEVAVIAAVVVVLIVVVSIRLFQQ